MSYQVAFKSFKPFNRYAPFKTFHAFGMNEIQIVFSRFQVFQSFAPFATLSSFQLSH